MVFEGKGDFFRYCGFILYDRGNQHLAGNYGDTSRYDVYTSSKLDDNEFVRIAAFTEIKDAIDFMEAKKSICIMK